MSFNKIPVTIITGFLGSGKTSFINSIIKQNPNERFAIIENEFGKLNIDGALVAVAKESISEISNGCICCSMQTEFTQVINRFVNHPLKFTHVIIETTGIANPQSIIKPFISNTNINAYFAINAVVCIVDALNLQAMENEHHEIHQQIAYADILIINKTENICAETISSLFKFLQYKNSVATIFTFSPKNINTSFILNANSYNPNKHAINLYKIEPATKQVSLLENLKHQTLPLKHNFESVAFEFSDYFDVERFSFWIKTFVKFNYKNVFRIKGILRFADTENLFTLHSVGDLINFDMLENSSIENSHSKLVFIGKNINRMEIQEALEELLIKKGNV